MPSELLPLHRKLQQTAALGALMDRAERIAELNRALRQWTQDSWFDSIRLANLRGDTVVLYADDAAALTPLRYRQAELLVFLRQRLQLNCVRIEVKVRPRSA